MSDGGKAFYLPPQAPIMSLEQIQAAFRGRLDIAHIRAGKVDRVCITAGNEFDHNRLLTVLGCAPFGWEEVTIRND
jgi:hypothetical protein